MRAIRRNLRISYKKVGLVADLVRGKSVEDALNFLQFTPKHSAKPLMETIRSAAANAEQNFKQQRKDLYVSTIVVNQGTTLKRSRPVSRGRSHPIRKHTSHIIVEVAVRAPEVAKMPAIKASKEKTSSKTVPKTTS